MLISITGKSGAGKTFIATKLENTLNAIHINFDEITHQILKETDIISQIKLQFEDRFIENNEINRKLLGDYVFSNPNQLTMLNQICQNKMEQSIDQIINQHPNELIILDYSLLPKMKYWNQSKIKILVKSNDALRRIRIIKRDKINKKYFLLRETASINYNEDDFDIIIENNNKLNFDKILSNIKEKLC